MKKLSIICLKITLVFLLWQSVEIQNANSTINLEYMLWAGTNNDGTPSLVHNYTPYGDGYRLFVEESSSVSGSFINDNVSGINIELSIGNYTFSYAGDAYELDQSKRYYGALFLRFYNDETQETGYASVWAPMDTETVTAVPDAYYEREGHDIYRSIPVYQDSQYIVTITEYMYSKDGVMGIQDWTSPYEAVPNGRSDMVGMVSFNVQPQLSANSACESQDVFYTTSPVEDINVSSTLPSLPSLPDTYDFYLVKDRTEWNDGDEICSLNEGLVSYWRFEEENNLGYDSVGDNHGTVNGAIWTPVGAVGAALSFDGNDYIDVPYDSSLNIINDALTVSAWVKFNDYGTTQQILSKRKDASTDYRMYLAKIDQVNYYLGFTGESGPYIDWGHQSNNYLTIDTWHHVVGVKDGSQIRLYIDGDLDKEAPASTSGFNATDGILTIGCMMADDYTTQTDFLNGQLDDVRIYNRALSESEIQELYTSPSCVAHQRIDIDSDGYFCDLLWTPNIRDENFYDIILDVDGDGLYDAGSDYIDSISL